MRTTIKNTFNNKPEPFIAKNPDGAYPAYLDITVIAELPQKYSAYKKPLRIRNKQC